MTITNSAIFARRWLLGALLCAVGCSPTGAVDNAPLPPDVPDPGVTKTPAGAVAAYWGAVSLLDHAVGYAYESVVPSSGLLSDELQANSLGGSTPWDDEIAVDSRVLPEAPTISEERYVAYTRGPYDALQSVRGQTHEARGLLERYAPDSTMLIGHLYAIEGYADVYLAELFCSGIPLSTLDYDGDYTLAPGSSTEEVYSRAIQLFDSASVLAGSNARIANLARVGRGRALLGLGDVAGAAQAVADVPDGYEYLATYSTSKAETRNFAWIPLQGSWNFNASDTAGANGLNFRSSGDRRTASYRVSSTIYHPSKYAADGGTPIVVASGVEARLIEAEAALRAGDAGAWLAKLNALRETAITPALPDTTDPGTADARVDLLFRERAFWLYLTGHRLGDLRRLVRQYGRTQSQVFPTGSYRGGTGAYGTDVTMPIPAAERAYNPLFSGCINRGA